MQRLHYRNWSIVLWKISFKMPVVGREKKSPKFYMIVISICFSYSKCLFRVHLETKMKFSRWMHTLTLGVKQLKIKSEILGWFWRQTLALVVMSKQVTKSAYYHLKNIARIRCFVSSQDLEKLVHAFITSRVDYCNGLLTGLPKKTIRQLQLIQNAAARIQTRTRKSEHITPVLRSLHWLPVTFRIDFKVLLLVYKSLNGLGP